MRRAGSEQLRTLEARLNDVGMSMTSGGLKYVGNLVGRQITTTNDLSRFDIARATNHLAAMIADPFGSFTDTCET